MDKINGYDKEKMDFPKVCRKCGAYAFDVQGKNISEILYMCGSLLYQDGSMLRNARCYERQLGAIKAKAQLISNESSSMLYDGDNLKHGCNQIIDASNEIIDSIA